MARYDFFCDDHRPFYEANVWIYNGSGDPLLLEYFTTKREAVSCVKRFSKSYKGTEKLDCFVTRFDECGFAEESWNLLV